MNELSLFTGLTTVAIAADLLFTALEKGIILDFGTGCFSQGHLRSGKIKRVYTGPLSEPGHSATTTFKKFKIDTIPVWRAHKIINTTYSAAGANQLKFKIELVNGKLTKPNGFYFHGNRGELIHKKEMALLCLQMTYSKGAGWLMVK
ncbi:MAG TPA: hypothetical protein VEY10_08690 [Flavisolibacter sp.]|nr:hypothetical protein [Flavisolibacter sp.]